MSETKKVIYRPELVLEYRLGAKRKESKLSVNDADDAIRILDGIKTLSDEHLVLIYLDGNDVVVGVDTFVCGINAFDVSQSSRALANAIQNQNREPSLKVIIAQTIPEAKPLSESDVDFEGLRTFSIRLAALQIELVDFILLGQEDMFSLRKDTSAWQHHQGNMEKMSKLFLDNEFLACFQKSIREKKDRSDQK